MSGRRGASMCTRQERPGTGRCVSRSTHNRESSCRAAQFPKPADYFFKPLHEHVPVYSGPFRIVQDVMLDPTKDGSAALNGVTSLTLTGTFEYQACDDRVCFAPQSVPLSWSIAVKPLDRDRVKPR